MIVEEIEIVIVVQEDHIKVVLEITEEEVEEEEDFDINFPSSYCLFGCNKIFCPVVGFLIAWPRKNLIYISSANLSSLDIFLCGG